MKIQLIIISIGIFGIMTSQAADPSPEAQACNEKIRLAITAKAEKTCKKNYSDLIWSDKEVDLVGNETTVAFSFKCKEKKQFIGIIKLGDIENLEACELSKPSTSVAKQVPKKPIYKKEKPTEEEITEAKVQLKQDLRPQKPDPETDEEAKERPENYETQESADRTAAAAEKDVAEKSAAKAEKKEKSKDKKTKKSKKDKALKTAKPEKKTKTAKPTKAKTEKKKKSLEPPLEDSPTTTTLPTEPKIDTSPTYIDEIAPPSAEELNK